MMWQAKCFTNICSWGPVVSHWRNGTKLSPSLLLHKSFASLERSSVSRFARLPRPKVSKEPQSKFFWLKLNFGVATGLGVKLCHDNAFVFCEANEKRTRLVGFKTAKEDPKFDWKQFLQMLKPHVWSLLAAIIAAFVVAIINIQIPQLLGAVINVVAKFPRREQAVFGKEVLGPAKQLAYMYFSQAIFTFAYIYLLSNIGEKIATTMKQNMFASVMKQDIAFFDQERTGEIINRLTIDIQDFKSSFKLCISQGLRSVTQIAGCAVSLFIISPEMTLGMLLIVPAVIVTGTLLGSFLRKLSKDAQAQVGKATAVAEEAVGNIRTVRAFAMEGKECELFNKESSEAGELNQRLGFGIGLFQGGTNLFLNGMVLSTLSLGGYLLSTNQVSAGDLMSFLVATQTIQRSLTQLSLLFGQLVKGLGAGARVFEYINLRPTIPITGGKIIPYHSLVADIEFKNVNFSYPTRPQQKVLKNFNLKLVAGKTVAVVGSSGNGKSTIAALLERFYDVDGGSIMINGVDIRNLDPSWLRGRVIGFINQEPVLFATSVMENIRYGCPAATDHQIIEAAKLANADEFIRGFPEGYSTVLGERGVTISGGQKQRIAIARALLKNPSILILDEATSALDAESEKIVQHALDNVTRGRTVLVIAHRLSTVQNADVIVVLNNGEVVEIGNHDSLKKLKGFYWNLIRQQERESSS